jgi:hypothetical protein
MGLSFGMPLTVQQNADYPNCQLTESLQPRNASAKKNTTVGFLPI